MPDRHRLAPLAAVPVGELADEPLIMFARDGAPDVWDLLVEGLGASRGSRRAAITQLPVGGQPQLARRVLRGEGVCPISETLAPQISRPGLVVRPVDPPLLVPLLLVWREPAAGTLRALIDEVS